MSRADGRPANQLRPVKIVRRYGEFAAGSVLLSMGKTRVLCTASIEEDVPRWMKSEATPPIRGWVTAEYGMLPGATPQRKRRGEDSRAVEIRRLIGRSLRAAVNLDRLGPRTIWIDCDVLQADGGTRTAAITGGYVALADAVALLLKRGLLRRSPIRGPVAAVSVGLVDGRVLLDLDYSEDSRAEVDLNLVMARGGRFVEVQGTGEGATFTGTQLQSMIRLGRAGILKLMAAQRAALK